MLQRLPYRQAFARLGNNNKKDLYSRSAAATSVASTTTHRSVVTLASAFQPSATQTNQRQQRQRLFFSTTNPTMKTLSNAVLEAKPQGLQLPMYDRADIKPAIVHVGLGNFHRAHMGSYLDDLLDQDENSRDWGILGAGVLHFDDDKRKLLQEQDWLQTLVKRDDDMAEGRVLGCMVDFLPVQYKDDEPEPHKALKEALLDPQIKIVSMTVTEGGYFLNSNTGHFDPENKNIKRDAENPDDPRTIFGIMLQALKKRNEKGIKPFTIMSCDNVPHNGDVCHEVTLGLAKMIDDELAKWVEDNVSFPNGMVDRITPATSDETKKFVKETYGYEDKAPLFCEPFRQWVLEDKFVNGRPPLEQVGVQFVDDVTPYELAKLRILNGGHASLCYPSALLGLDCVHNAMEHDVIAPFLDTLEKNEMIPSCMPVPDTDLPEYWEIIKKRFSNPTLADTIGRNCYNGSDRQPKFIIPVATDNAKDGKSVQGLATVSAMWCRYCQGTTESGEKIEANDTIWDRLNETANKAKEDPQVWLDMDDIYGDLGKDSNFKEAFAKALKTVNEEGVEAAMKAYIESKKAVEA